MRCSPLTSNKEKTDLASDPEPKIITQQPKKVREQLHVVDGFRASEQDGLAYGDYYPSDDDSCPERASGKVGQVYRGFMGRFTSRSVATPQLPKARQHEVSIPSMVIHAVSMDSRRHDDNRQLQLHLASITRPEVYSRQRPSSSHTGALKWGPPSQTPPVLPLPYQHSRYRHGSSAIASSDGSNQRVCVLHASICWRAD
jgi:hypothetical protein